MKTRQGLLFGFALFRAAVIFFFFLAGCATVNHAKRDALFDENGLSNFMEQLAAEDSFSGVVLIARGGKVYFERAYGMADRSQNQSNNIDTKFNLGSVAKIFTAIAIAQLAEQGKLSFDDTIEKYVDGFSPEVAGKITVQQLLTHTAGLGDIFTPAYMTGKDEVDTIGGFMPYITSQDVLFEPGTQHQYSNGGFVVLGAIIEKVSGENYYQYIRNHITGPSGMADTDFYKKFDLVPNLARGYTNPDGGPQLLPPLPTPGQGRIIGPPPIADRNAAREDNLPTLPLIGNPSGGAYSTARDMLAFSSALMNHTLLSKEYTAAVMSGYVRVPRGEYGYGFEIFVENGHRTAGHSGGAPGVSAMFRILVDDDCTVIVLSNYDDGVRRPYEEIIRHYIPVPKN
ncbi:MAG: beta-lactamase family protein [Spirochaetaceae bacterium]|jgi:CubicO group peptidase (beta-lactamase class C family)|nr:beta-lactamase family protein [Spirochaetaceae bacterium]